MVGPGKGSGGATARRSPSRSLSRLTALAAATAAITTLVVRPPADAAHSGPSLSRMVGQSVMGGFVGTTPSADFLARIRRGELGGVILFGGNVSTIPQVKAMVAQLRRAALDGGNPRLLVAVDQEGGIVKRLASCPPESSASSMGAGSAAASRASGLKTGRCLQALGIDLDLAPVLDVGDSGTSFLGSRIFSSNPSTTASVGTAFAMGLQAARVAATAKHFPGLGTAPGNTDLTQVTVTTSKRELERRLATFRRAIHSGVKLVMVSSATYPALDSSGLPAFLSRAITTDLLRKSLGFRGVTITDTMSGPAVSSRSDAATKALAAGIDIVLYPDDESASATGYAQLVSAARSGALPRARIGEAYGRIQRLKVWLSN